MKHIALAAGIALALPAVAQDYPTKPIRIIAQFTPGTSTDKLNAEMKRILTEPDVKERLATLAFTPVGDSREQFAAYIKSEIVKWGKAVKDSGATAN